MSLRSKRESRGNKNIASTFITPPETNENHAASSIHDADDIGADALGFSSDVRVGTVSATAPSPRNVSCQHGCFRVRGGSLGRASQIREKCCFYYDSCQWNEERNTRDSHGVSASRIPIFGCPSVTSERISCRFF